MGNVDFNPILESITADRKVTPKEAKTFLDFYETHKGGFAHYTKENLQKLRDVIGIQSELKFMTEIERAKLRELQNEIKITKSTKKEKSIPHPKKAAVHTVAHVEKKEVLQIPNKIRGRGIWNEIVLKKGEIEMIAKMIWGEAEGETITGKQRVAEVIFFRMMDGNFGGKHVKKVLYKKSGDIQEFSPIADGRYKKAPIRQDIINIVTNILSSGKSLFGEERPLFFQKKTIEDGWINKNRKLIYAGDDSNHSFYA